MLVGVAGDAIPVEVDDRETVVTLKKMIKNEISNEIMFSAPQLELYLAKRNGMWLAYASNNCRLLRSGDTQHVPELLSDEKLPPVEPIIDVFHGINAFHRVIYVLVKLTPHDAHDA